MRRFTFLMAMAMLAAINAVAGTTVPFKILNNTQGQFNDDQIYIAIIGAYNGTTIYYDLSNNYQNNASIPALNTSVNTLHKQSGDWGYANVFYKLSDIRDKTIHVDHTNACRMFISFNSPMYLHAFDAGYAGADLNNPSDPNANVRWELIEFTYDQYNVMFVNTTRVDAFQYPMGVELYGTSSSNNAYMKRGELMTYGDIINRWNNWYGSSLFSACYYNSITTDGLGGIVKQPSKVSSIKNAGYFDDYINRIWNYFRNNDIYVSMGILGTWKGRVNGDAFVLTSVSGNYYANGTVATIPYKPSTNDAIEGAGAFATAAGTTGDLPVQAMFCGAINRGVIRCTTDLQDWSPTGSNYFNTDICNEYVKFFHQSDLVYDGYTYAFAYDDTFDQSATCATSNPDHVTVTIGGFVNGGGEGGSGGGGGGGVDPNTIPAAPSPTVASSNVKSIFSGAYSSITPNMFVGSWGQATAASNVYCSGDEAYQWTNFNYLGLQLTGDDSTVGVSDMETLHVDIYPLSSMSIGICPIALNPTDDSHTVTKQLTANQWNSFDIPLSDFGSLDFSRLGQIKFDGGSGQTLFVDNIYFYKGSGGGGGSSDIPAAPTPTVASSNVKSIFSGAYSSITPNMFVGSWGQATSASNVYCGGDETYQWTNFNYLGLQLTGDDSTVGVSDMETLHIDIYPLSSMSINIYPIALNPTDDTHYVTKSLTANQWNSFDIPLSDFGSLDFSKLGQFKFDGGSGQTLYVDNIYFYKGSGGGGGGSTIPAAPTPTKEASKVKSVYSGQYTSPDLSVPEWAWQWLKTSDGGLTKVSLDGDEALHLATFNFAAYEWSSAINASDMEYIHIDVYPVNASDITVHINGDQNVFVGKSLTAGQWNSFDIPLSDFSGQSLSSVGSIKLTGANGADADGTKDLYVDNIYFWTNGGGGGGSSTISPAPTPTRDSNKVQSLLSDAYNDNHGAYYAQWWDGQAKFVEEELASGDKAWHISNFIFLGIEHNKMDVSGMQALHLDIYPVGSNVTLSVFPINEGENEAYKQITATANQWNQIDISIADLKAAGLSMTQAMQIKLTGASGQNDTGSAEFYLDNIYYWSNASTGVDRISVNGAIGSADVYSLDGRLVRRGATSLSGLQKGIYVVNGRKVVVR